MHRPHTLRLAAAAIVVAAVAAITATTGAAVTSATAWGRISGPTGGGIELGLARTPDGVLHVIWNRGNPAPTSIFDTRISPAGKAQGTTTVATNFGGANGLALLVMPDKTLRLFASGTPVTGSSVGGINTFTAGANGTGWKLDQGVLWGGPIAEAASTIGATLTKDGQPVTSWGGLVKVGLDTTYPTTPFEGFMGSSVLATDGASGAIVLSGEEINQQGGTFVKQVLPSTGPSAVLPSATRDGGVSGASARLGAPGVYVAYENATRAGVSKPAVKLYRYGGATRTIAFGQFTTAKVFAGPDGRLWLAWGDNTDGIFVTRTNRAAGSLEPVQKLTPPPGTSYVWNAQGEGSTGPLDLFVDVSAGSGRGFWHTHVFPLMSLQASVARRAGKATTAKVSLALRDAGDAVPAATITVAGKRLKTDRNGQTSVALRPGTYSATATAGGYTPATAKFTVR
jgi:hypothetical protein